MSCFNPIPALLGKEKPNGKREIVFQGAKDQRADGYIKLPCGKCIGCLRNRAREWAIRCVHESKLHECSSFVTLTYAPEHLPPGGSLDVSHFQGFMNRLRKLARRKYGVKKLRFFHCGEYGPKLLRPHYHALIFGFDFPDKRVWSRNKRGEKWYISEELAGLWPFGFSTIGALTQQSCEYVARYTLKKVYGQKAADHYGEKKPEYVTMSRRPGIGAGWYDKYKSWVYGPGILVFNGVKQMPPRFYDSRFQKEDPDRLDEIKEDRKRRAAAVRCFDNIDGKVVRVDNNDSFRLPVRERIVQDRMRKLKRFMEDS